MWLLSGGENPDLLAKSGTPTAMNPILMSNAKGVYNNQLTFSWLGCCTDC